MLLLRPPIVIYTIVWRTVLQKLVTHRFFLASDSLVVSCGYDADVNLWNMNTYKLHQCFKVASSKTVLKSILCTL